MFTPYENSSSVRNYEDGHNVWNVGLLLRIDAFDQSIIMEVETVS